MEEQVFSNIWYASDEHLNTVGRNQSGTLYEDKGFLAVTGDALEFRGLKGIVQIHDIQALTVAKRPLPTFNRLSVFFLAGLFALCGVCGGGLLPISMMAGNDIGDAGGTAVLLFVVGIVLLFGAAAFAWYGYNATPWISVTYHTSQGEARIYLADGRFFGWGGIAGGTKQLYEQLRKIIR